MIDMCSQCKSILGTHFWVLDDKKLCNTCLPRLRPDIEVTEQRFTHDRPPPEVVKLRRLEKKLARARQARDEARRELAALKRMTSNAWFEGFYSERDARYKLQARFDEFRESVNKAQRVASGLEKDSAP